MVKGSDGKVRIWHRETHAGRQLHEAWAFSFKRMLQLSEFNCEKRLANPLRRRWLAENGEELKNENLEALEAQPISPESVTELVFNHACRKTSPPVAGAAEKEDEPAADAPDAKNGKAVAKEAPPPSTPGTPPPWSYDGKSNGPAHWGKLATEYASCRDGKRQSPIDIRSPIRADLPPLRFSWQAAVLAIIDTGQTIEINAEGAGKTLVEGEEYMLQHVRFRLPGEEMVNGKRATMSIQFEHRSKSGETAIVAVPVAEGKENRLIRTLWSALPLQQGKPVKMATKIDLGQLLPQKREYSSYVGSLTTPPCTEGVLWLVLKQPITLSKEQIADFAKVYRNNVRPVQATNGRIVKSNR